MNTLESPKYGLVRRLSRLALLVLAASATFGCGREFYREWANQDVSEAVFEKSRDPRFRLDLFSIDPPSLSRFTDPYDPDTPPAPPDDHTSEALSPAPQWPDVRLITPAEGTGYLDMLETWKRQRPEPPSQPLAPEPQPRTLPPPVPPPPGLPSPFQPAPNSGPGAAAMSPSSLPVPQPPNQTRPPGAIGPQTRTQKSDLGVRVAAFQETGLPMPVPPRDQPSAVLRELRRQPPRDLPTPPIGMDPNPINSDLAAPFNPRPDLTPEQYRASEAMTGEILSFLAPPKYEFNEAEAAGLPRDATPYVITLEQAFTLALINSRFYQFQLEQLYITALAVTLQRFAFQPQFFAGLTPSTGVPSTASATALGAPGVAFAPNPINQFLYRTRETGGPTSALTLGEAAGYGKLFSSGARLAAGFANQVVFNFLGKNSSQPTVSSFLPLTLVQPFLRGGGRAVTLEFLTQAERNLVYQVRTFAQFRQQFMITILVGGTVQNFGSLLASQGFSASITGNIDPIVGYLNVLQDLQEMDNDYRNIAFFERLLVTFRELVQGESSGLSPLQVDQIDSQLQSARQALVQDRTTYRNDLDQFKIQMGMPPDVPVVLDRRLTSAFKNTFDNIDEWQRDARRDLTDLPNIVAGVPVLEDVIIDGRSCLAVFRDAKNNAMMGVEDPLEGVLLAGERVALERRLDVMNQRAGLYDAWRQLRVTANALRGILNVTLTNQFLTPPTTTNPFAFLEQSKQFSLVLNAELPLVRLAERNNFRQALINYQRARRTLMNIEDFTKYQIRSDVRNLHQQYLNYEIGKRNLVLSVRQKDQAGEQLIAPPAGAAGTAQVANAATQTNNLTGAQNRILGIQNALVIAWLQYELQRLQLYRDLGTLPYDEWEAFHELFPSEPVNRDVAGGSAVDPGLARSPAPPAAEVIRQ
jgi:hypothetical protein